MPPRVKSPTVMLRLPAPIVSATAAVMRLRLRVKSTRFSTQIRAPVAASSCDVTAFTAPRVPQGMKTGVSISPSRLLCTGQVCAACSSFFFASSDNSCGT